MIDVELDIDDAEAIFIALEDAFHKERSNVEEPWSDLAYQLSDSMELLKNALDKRKEKVNELKASA